MCFGEVHSRITFTIGTLFTLLLLYYAIVNRLEYETFIIIIYWYSAVTMQLWEALIHNDYKNNNGKNCEIYSKITYYNNILQPVILAVLLRRPEAIIPVFIYILVIIKYAKQEKCILYDGQIKLKWWNNSDIKILAPISYALLSIFLLSLLKNKLSLVLFILTYIGSALIYWDGRTGAIWCYFSSFVPILFFILLLMKNN